MSPLRMLTTLTVSSEREFFTTKTAPHEEKTGFESFNTAGVRTTSLRVEGGGWRRVRNGMEIE